MNAKTFGQKVWQRLRTRPAIIALTAVITIAILVAVAVRDDSAGQADSYYEVKRGDFLISIVEGGTLEAVNDVSIRSEVEGTARIIYIVPEGSTVKKGDLLVELDSSTSQDAVNQQQIAVEKAQFAYIQAQQQLEIQKSVVDSDIDAAALKVELAQMDLDKFRQAERLQLARNGQIEVTNVLETLKIAEERLEWTKKLYEKGFETKANLDKDTLAVKQGQLKLEQAKQALNLIVEWDNKKKERELESTLEAARDNLERVKKQGERVLAQYEADVLTQKSTLDLSKAKLERDLKQLAATKIYAPQDGLVVYAGAGDRRFSSESMIEEGAVVRNRQELIKLPDISEMKLQVKIHESHVNHMRPGQTAFVVLDSMPDQRYRGVVNRIAPLPDSSSRWGNPNLKVYPTEILIVDPLPNVKPGVSANAEIVITNLQDVVTVPIQAVTTRQGQQVVYLPGDPPQAVPVSVGMYNTKFIEITSGLNQGDLVLLSPPFDSEEKDLGGAILAKSEVPPLLDSDTNRMSRVMERVRNGGGRGNDSSRALGDGESAPVPATIEGRGFREAVGLPTTDEPGRSRRGGPRGDGASALPGNGAPGGGRGDRPRGEGGPRFNREEMLKQFDTDGDGELSETERAAMRQRFGGGRERRTPNQTPTAPPDGATQ